MDLTPWRDFLVRAALQPDNLAFHYQLSLSCQAVGRAALTTEHFHRVVSLNTDLAEAHNNLGVCLAGMGRKDEALSAFDRALHLKPEYAEAHNNPGIALVDQGNLEQGVAHFRQALVHNRSYPEAFNNLPTSTASRANRMLIPVWVLLPFNPDWRWLLDRDDSLWCIRTLTSSARSLQWPGPRLGNPFAFAEFSLIPPTPGNQPPASNLPVQRLLPRPPRKRKNSGNRVRLPLVEAIVSVGNATALTRAWQDIPPKPGQG